METNARLPESILDIDKAECDQLKDDCNHGSHLFDDDNLVYRLILPTINLLDLNREDDFLDSVFCDIPAEAYQNVQFRNVIIALRYKMLCGLEQYFGTRDLPKFYYEEDDDSFSIKMISDVGLRHAMIYFRLEEEQNDSSFGLIWRDTGRGYYISESRRLTDDSLDMISDVAVKIMEKMLRCE